MKNQFLFTFLLILLFQKAIAQVPNSERDALIDLALATDVASWNNFNWDIDNPVSTWFGITVTNISGTDHVTIINLGSNNLIGEIPSSIGDFPYLTELNLSRNQLSGNIPAEIGNLSSLEHLYLWRNQLDGEIPIEIGSCSNLLELFLDENELTGNIPTELSSLSQLISFFVSDNLLTGDITNIYSSWSNLYSLGISQNDLTGDLDLSSCAGLRYLWASETTLSTINIQNGSNTNLRVSTTDSPNLTCIQVDNEVDATNAVIYPYTIWNKDDTTVFSEDCNSLSLEDFTINNDLAFYPNPIVDNLNVENNLNSKIRIEVYTISGVKLFTTTINEGNTKINFSDYKSGIYMIKTINNDNSIKTYKALKI